AAGTVAAAGADLRRDLYHRGNRVLVSTWHRRARRERLLQRSGGGEAERRRDRADASPARSRQTGLLLQRPALLHADFRAERDFVALAVGDLFADHIAARIRPWTRDVRREHGAGGV